MVNLKRQLNETSRYLHSVPGKDGEHRSLKSP